MTYVTLIFRIFPGFLRFRISKLRDTPTLSCNTAGSTIIGFLSLLVQNRSISINQHSARLRQRRRFILVTYACIYIYTPHLSINCICDTSRIVKISRIYLRREIPSCNLRKSTSLKFQLDIIEILLLIKY